MTDRPMIFSAPMIRALIAGRKTQTRRLIRPQPTEDIGLALAEHPLRYAAGDRLWVREAHMLVGGDPGHPIYREGWRRQAEREGFENIPDEEPKGWRPSIHMPRWASRLTLTVEGVRVQRLQGISEEDAIAEGLIKLPASGRYVVNLGEQYLGLARHTAKACYADLWNDLHGPQAWEANPWVVALTFHVEQRNIDVRPEAA